MNLCRQLFNFLKFSFIKVSNARIKYERARVIRSVFKAGNYHAHSMLDECLAVSAESNV